MRDAPPGTEVAVPDCGGSVTKPAPVPARGPELAQADMQSSADSAMQRTRQEIGDGSGFMCNSICGTCGRLAQALSQGVAGLQMARNLLSGSNVNGVGSPNAVSPNGHPTAAGTAEPSGVGSTDSD